MKVLLEKQPRKYLRRADEPTRKKLLKALDDIAELKGNIVPLGGKKTRFRYKIEHYRIVFDWVKGSIIIRVIEINTRTNIHY